MLPRVDREFRERAFHCGHGHVVHRCVTRGRDSEGAGVVGWVDVRAGHLSGPCYLHKGASKYLERPAELREAQVLIVLGRQGATKGSYP